MDNPKADKVAVVDEVRSRLDGSDAVIVTEYRGLKVKDLSGLRRSLKPLGAEYRIYKNTLVRIAANDSGDGFSNLLTGPTGLTFVKGDAAAVTKALRDFSRANQLLIVKGSLLGRSVLGPQDTLALADLPSREVLLARLAGGLSAPLQTFAGLLQALPRNFAYGLKALVDKKVASGDTSGSAAAPSGPAEVAASAPAEAASSAPSAAAEAAEPAVAETAGPIVAEDAEPAGAAPAEGADEAAPSEGAEHAPGPDSLAPPAAETPAGETPAAETPAAETPAAEAPAAEAPADAESSAATADEPNTAEPAEGSPEAAPSAGAEHAPEPDSPAEPSDVATEADVATESDVASQDDAATEAE